MKSPDPDESLSRTLANWPVVPARNPQFRSKIWGRIKEPATAPTWSGYARAHASLVVGTLALAIALGAMTGRERARAQIEAESSQLATSYVQALDARNMRMP